jgi:glycosyltransferase involved in cell wall biosynthesis
MREFGQPDHGLIADWGIGIHKRIIGKATARIAVSDAIRSYYARGRTAGHIHLIYNGIAFERKFDELRARGTASHTGDHPTTFAIIGFMRPQKAQHEAIRALALAAKSLNRVRLLVVGGGEPAYVSHCQNLAAELGVEEDVEFWGYTDDPYQPILEADALVMCSRNEGMGRVTAEAMAACRPVIGFDRAGTSELVRDGYNGLLYTEGSEQLADCMVRLGQDKAWARELGLNGWEWARETCCVETYAKRVYDVLLSTLGRGKHP